MRYRAKMKAKKEKAVQKLFLKEEISNIPSHSPLKSKHPEVSFTSFVQRRSVMVCKLLTDKPATAVAIMKHVWQREYKHPEKRKLMNKFWKLHINLAQIMLDIGKHKGRKDQVKLHECVDKVKQKYNSLRQACWFADISWTKFHRHTYVKVNVIHVKRDIYVNCPTKILIQLRSISNQTTSHFHFLIRNTWEKGL